MSKIDFLTIQKGVMVYQMEPEGPNDTAFFRTEWRAETFKQVLDFAQNRPLTIISYKVEEEGKPTRYYTTLEFRTENVNVSCIWDFKTETKYQTWVDRYKNFYLKPIDENIIIPLDWQTVLPQYQSQD